jgi:putative phosphoserine phosphatase/1-acylglycerol-3-phosphate O-acyltransferase
LADWPVDELPKASLYRQPKKAAPTKTPRKAASKPAKAAPVKAVKAVKKAQPKTPASKVTKAQPRTPRPRGRS